MSQFPFEALVRRQLRKFRALSGNAGLLGYVNQDQATQPVQGDEHGPYIHTMVRASEDGETGAVSVANGEPQLVLSDELGRLWTRAILETDEDGAASLYRSSTSDANVGVLVKAGGGRIFQMRALMTDPAGARYAMVFDKLTAPVNGDTPIWRALLPDPTGTLPGEVQDNWGGDIGGLSFLNGLGVAISTTVATLTLINEDVYWHVTYT